MTDFVVRRAADAPQLPYDSGGFRHRTVHTLRPRLHDTSAIVLFGGQAKKPAALPGGYHGGDRQRGRDRPRPDPRRRTGGGAGGPARPDACRLATMADVVDAVDFLLRNHSVNAIDLNIDGGRLLG